MCEAISRTRHSAGPAASNQNARKGAFPSAGCWRTVEVNYVRRTKDLHRQAERQRARLAPDRGLVTSIREGPLETETAPCPRRHGRRLEDLLEPGEWNSNTRVFKSSSPREYIYSCKAGQSPPAVIRSDEDMKEMPNLFQ
jgi:hypothetical protein